MGIKPLALVESRKQTGALIFARINSSIVPQPAFTTSAHRRSRGQFAVRRPSGSKSRPRSVDELALEQATGGLVKEDIGIAVEPGEKLVQQVSSFVLGSAREPELGEGQSRMQARGETEVKERSPRRRRSVTLIATRVWPELRARRC